MSKSHQDGKTYSKYDLKLEKMTLNCSISPVGWSCRIHRLRLCRGVKLPQRVSCGSVDWGCRIHRWHLSRRVRLPPPKYPDMTLNKVKVRSPNGDADYLDIVAGLLLGNTLASYLFIICLDYVLRTSIHKIKENGFKLTKEKRLKVPCKNNYRRQLRRWHSASGKYTRPSRNPATLFGMSGCWHWPPYQCTQNGRYVLYQTGDITLNGSPLKLVDKFTYLGSSVSSTENDINTRLAKPWAALWKSDLTDKMKRSFFQAAVVLILLYGCITWTLTKRTGKKFDSNDTRMLRAIMNNLGGNTPQSRRCTATYYQSRKLSKLEEPDMRDTSGEVWTSS